MSSFDGLKNNFRYHNFSIPEVVDVSVSLFTGNNELDGVKLTNTSIYQKYKLYESKFHFPFSIYLMHGTAFDENGIQHYYYLNNYLKVESNLNGVIGVRLWDNAIYNFHYEYTINKYYCSELDTYLILTEKGFYLETSDKQKIYYHNEVEYPYKIERSSVDILLFELKLFSEGYRITKITNAVSETATFSYTGNNLTKIHIEKLGLAEDTKVETIVTLNYGSVTDEDRTVLTGIVTHIVTELDDETVIQNVQIGEEKDATKRTFYTNNVTTGESFELFTIYKDNGYIDSNKVYINEYKQGNCYKTIIYKNNNHTKIENSNYLPAGQDGANEKLYSNIYFIDNKYVDFEVSPDGQIAYNVYNSKGQLVTTLPTTSLNTPDQANLFNYAKITSSEEIGVVQDKLLPIEDKYRFSNWDEKNSLMIYSKTDSKGTYQVKIPLDLLKQNKQINDIYTIRFFAKKKVFSLNDIFATIQFEYVTLSGDKKTIAEYLINLPTQNKSDSNLEASEVEYKYNIFEFKIPESYKEVSIIINTALNFTMDGIKLHYINIEKRSALKQYTYFDDVNKVKEVNSNLSKTEYKYNEEGRLYRVVNSGKSDLKLGYKEGKVETVTGNYGLKVRTHYSLLELPTEVITSNRNNTIKSRKINNYLKETELLQSEIDEQGRRTAYNYDNYYKLDTINHPNDRTDIILYDYKNRVYSTSFNDINNNVVYTYDQYNRINTVQKSDGTKYKFVYFRDKLEKVLQVDNDEEKVLVTYDYVMDDSLYITDLIKSKKYGNCDKSYIFSYDKYGKPLEVKYGDTSLGTYTYDKFNYIMFKNDTLVNRRTYYDYFTDGNLKRVSLTDLNTMTTVNDIYYTYNAEGKLLSKDKYLIDSDDVIRECTRDYYNSVQRSSLQSPEVLHNELKKINGLNVCSFLDDCNLENKDDKVLKPTLYGAITKEDIPYYQCGNNIITYQKSGKTFIYTDIYMGCTCTDEGSGVIMDLRNITSNFRIETRVTPDKYAEVNVYTTPYENCKLTIKSDETLQRGSNLISVMLYRYPNDKLYVYLYVNSKGKGSNVDGSYFNYSNTTLLYSYGGTKGINIQKYANYNGKLYNILFSENSQTMHDKLDNMVNLCYDYLEHNKKVITDTTLGSLPYYSNVTHIKQDYYERVESSELTTLCFPLINDYNALSPYNPLFEMEIEDNLLEDNTIDREFDFDNDKNTYVSKILKKMSINPFFSTKGLVQFDLKIEKINGINTIFSFKNPDITMSLTVEPNNESSYSIYLKSSTSKLTLNYDQWYRIEIKYIYGSSYNTTLTIGSQTQSVTYYSNKQPTEMHIVFTKENTYGHLSQILTHKGYYSDFFNVNKTITNTKKYDEINRLKVVDVKTDYDNIINRIFDYRLYGSYKTNEINKETIKTNKFEEEYSYSYDSIGNLLSITKDNNVLVNYTYDKLGQLLSETKDNVTINYTYDNFGNILTNGSKIYTYDKFKRLVSISDGVNSTIVEYDNLFHLNPIKIKSSDDDPNPIILEYEGKRLKTYTKGDKLINFEYDLEGNRTTKKVGDKVYNYIYEDSLLIKEDHNGIEIKYLYDEQNLLYGFIVGGDAYYYYKRDIFQNILGIIDEEGNEIVSYKYDAWGNMLSETCTNEAIKDLNSFRYKGYYYDVETQLFWVSSRYYSPEFGRFLQVSDVSELNPHSINGLNLYAYANNNPISYSYNNVSKKVVPTLSGSVVPNNMNVVLLPSSIGGTTNKTSTNPLSFSVGLLTPEKYDMPSWMSVYAFYAKGTLGWGYTFGDGYSLASFSAGVLDATFHTPKWFSSLPDDHWANPNIYLGFGTWNVNASIGAGISGTAEIISGTVGIQFGDAISIGVKGYVGIGFTIDFTNGIKFGVGWGLGYEISLNIDWYELFH